MILPYVVILPLLAAFLIALAAGRRVRAAWIIAMTATTASTALAVIAFATRSGERLVYAMGGWPPPAGIGLVQDALSLFMLITVGLIALTSLLYSPAAIRPLSPEGKYYALFMVLIAGMNGVIAAGDLFNLFVFMEIALFAAFALVAYGGRAHEYEASFKYAVAGAISASIILIGIAVVYAATSTLTMASIARAMARANPALVLWTGGLLLAGFGLKAAVMPFHAWLPDAHSSAPAPISAMLSGVLIKALGIYVLIRVFFTILGAPKVFTQAFLVLGTVSILLGVLLAVGQWDIKRLLAYHSISQIGYILIGLGLNTALGLAGAVFHLFNHALFKSLLFYNAGALEAALGTRDLRKMGRVSRILPITSQTSLAASLSISGIPPFNGFFSKLILIVAAVQAGQVWIAGLAAVGSLLTLASFMKVQRYGLRGERTAEADPSRIGSGMKAAMIILAILCLVSSLLIVPGVRERTLDPVVDAIQNRDAYIRAVLGE